MSLLPMVIESKHCASCKECAGSLVEETSWRRLLEAALDAKEWMLNPWSCLWGLLGARLEACHPQFTFTGVDLFGLLTFKWGHRTAKRWGYLFTCLTTCAVYLTVMLSLETDDFIMVLCQFISTRWLPQENLGRQRDQFCTRQQRVERGH